MKFGAVLPTNEIGHDTGAVKAWAQGVDEMGYDRIVMYDHVLGAVHDGRQPPLTGPYTEADPFREPMVLCGYLAAATQRVELMPGVLVLPQRQTALVAKQAAEIDLLSGGRFVLGVGTGWNYVEYESLGIDYRSRARRFEEQIEVLRALWAERVLDYEGSYHRIDRAGIFPLPERQIPIWFGGGSDAALRRAAAIGDGFYFGAAGRRTVEMMHGLREQVAAGGRDAAAFGVAGQIHTARGPEASGKDARVWREGGGSHLFVSTMSGAMAAGEMHCETVDDHLAVLQQTLETLRAL